MPNRFIRLLISLVKWLSGHLTWQELLIHFMLALLMAWLAEVIWR